MKDILYFAYGSNMSYRRLAARIEITEKLGRAVLPSHRLAFHKVSIDGSAKCDVVPHETGRVHGVLYRIRETERERLDLIEGVGQGYECRSVSVRDVNRQVTAAICYFGTRIDPQLQPYDWYLDHVLIGAQEAGLPQEYIETIRQTDWVADKDVQRAMVERNIYE